MKAKARAHLRTKGGFEPLPRTAVAQYSQVAKGHARYIPKNLVFEKHFSKNMFRKTVFENNKSETIFQKYFFENIFFEKYVSTKTYFVFFENFFRE